MTPVEAHTICNVINKKKNQINKFYDSNYEDCRAHLVLRIKALLSDFWLKHSEAFGELEKQYCNDDKGMK